MSSIGPELPPHLLKKRKRQSEKGADRQNPATATSELIHNRSDNTSSPSSSEGDSKRLRTLGPVPALTSPQDLASAESDKTGDSDDDGVYGPILPTPEFRDHEDRDEVLLPVEQPISQPAEADRHKPQRDEWMTLPPTQDDLAARMDPTKARARKFNTGKAIRGPGQPTREDNKLWTENPEEKRKRLQDEQLGVTHLQGTTGETGQSSRRRIEEDEKAKGIKEHNDKYRATSLLSQHKASKVENQKEDDPNKRGFDYEKDMSATKKIGHAQKRELLGKAAQFGSRFAGGGFL